MAPDRFHICLPSVLRQECPLPDDWSNLRNYSNDSHDPGGATMCGITQREYDLFRLQKGFHVQAVSHITRDEGEEIYESSYWLPYSPELAPGADLCFFDESVNAGPHEAIKILQMALDITADGTWGPMTELAARGVFHDTANFIGAFTKYRIAYYESLAGYRYFGKGWIARSRAICEAALAMAKGT